MNSGGVYHSFVSVIRSAATFLADSLRRNALARQASEQYLRGRPPPGDCTGVLQIPHRVDFRDATITKASDFRYNKSPRAFVTLALRKLPSVPSSSSWRRS